MKCTEIRSQLLNALDPAQPDAEIESHLAECSACRHWQRQLIQVERNARRLPVPASSGCAAVVQRLLHPEATNLPVVEQEKAPAPRPARDEETPFPHNNDFKLPFARPTTAAAAHVPWGRQQRAIVGAGIAAAGLLLVVSCWMIAHRGDDAAQVRGPRPPGDALMARLVDRDMKLATAQHPRERVRVLADMADDIQNETVSLVNNVEADDLMPLAQLYKRVVHEGVIEQARVLPQGERDDVLGPIGDRFTRTCQDAEAMGHDTPASANAMKVIADAAREGGAQLHAKASTAEAWTLERTKPGTERLHQLQQNRELVNRLVESGIYLAAAVDPLKRADVCNVLARFFALEVGVAADKHDGPRAVELGVHFQCVLRQGVAENLTAARQQIPLGSTRDLEMQRVGREVDETAGPVEKQLVLAGNDPPEMGDALAAVRDGRDEVRRIFERVNDRSGKSATR